VSGVRTALDVLAVVFVLAGCGFAFFAGLGLMRFPDVLSRLQAGTKPQVTAVVLIMVGAAIRLEGLPVLSMLIIAGLLQMLTAPVSAHLLGRVAYRRRHVREDLLVVHETGHAGLTQPGDDEGDRPADGEGGAVGPDQSS
jgi:multicomponent Na+:H+ antiporter subunit G